MRIVQIEIISVALLLSICFSAAHAAASKSSGGLDASAFPEVKRLHALLQQPESKMDLGRIKLTIDKMVEPATDIDAGIKQLDIIASKVRVLAGINPSSNDTMLALKKYLYESGPWNDYKPYHYDFNDPKGTKIQNKLLLNYLSSRSGNCVSMPLLFIILGDRLGIDVTASTAPQHIFVKYKDRESGITVNLEATSGANPARDVWYTQTMPMTKEASANGIYMQKLTKKETVAVMAGLLAENCDQKQEYDKAIAITDVLLEYYPKDIASMLMKGHAYYQLLSKHFIKKYPVANQIPMEERGYFQHLSDNNRYWFTKAESLGWREPTPDDEKAYQRMVKRNAKSTSQ